MDATEWHFLSLNKALNKICNMEISVEDHESIFNGWPTKNKLEYLVSQNKINHNDINDIWNLKQKLTIETIKENIKIDLEKITLHKHMFSKNIRMACVTNSINETAKLMLAGSGQLEFIEVLISNDMVKKPKPHAEGYIKAMVMLNCLPEESLIIEDSEKGILAAESTGAKLLKIKHCNEVNIDNISKELW